MTKGAGHQAVEARAAFDRFATLYDLARPGYPTAAISDLRRLGQIDESSRIFEIGCGTGKFTGGLAVTGARIRCVEPGAAMAELARTNLREFANVEITNSTFESFAARPATYDVVVSATAFHWIDPKVSYARAAGVLRTGGHLALLTNAHGAGGTHTHEPFAHGVQELNGRLAPELGAWTFPTAEEIDRRARAGGDIAAVWARVERRLWDPPPVSDLFEPPTVNTYRWVAHYDRNAYLAMLATQSSYAVLDDQRRTALLDGIGKLIDMHLGDVVTKEYVTILATARTSQGGPDNRRRR